MVGGFVVALGLAFGVGRGVQWVWPEEPPVVCPEVPMAERFAGHIAGPAQVVIERIGAQIEGVVPGPHPAGPEPLERLTIVQGDRLYRTSRFERTIQPGGAGFRLTIPISELELETPIMFVTSACVPDHPTRLRYWRLGSFEDLARSFGDEEAALRAYLREVVPADEQRAVDRVRMRVVGAMETDLPGCARPGVVMDTDRDEGHPLAALVCLGPGNAVTQTLFGPSRDSVVVAMAALDLDGDGHDELVAVHREGTHARSVLIHREPAKDGLAAIQLGPAGPGY